LVVVNDLPLRATPPQPDANVRAGLPRTERGFVEGRVVGNPVSV